MSKNNAPCQGSTDKDGASFAQNISKPNHKAQRRVIRRAPHRNVGVITLPWFQADPIEWESQLERKCIYAAVALWAVKQIAHQPYRIPMPPGGSERHYTPDFAIELRVRQWAGIPIETIQRCCPARITCRSSVLCSQIALAKASSRACDRPI